MNDSVEMSEALAADLCEIIEALEIPVMTNSADQLIDVVDRCKGALADSNVSAVLDKARDIFISRRGFEPERFMFSRNRAAEDAAAKLKLIFPSWPHYVYHGTSSKALASILENGLIPNGGKSSWTGIVDEDYLSAGVFLSADWRGAVSWAQSTALTRAWQLRKDGSVPTIIRIPATYLRLAEDVRVRRPGCLFHPGEIDVSDALCFAITEPDGHAPRELPVWLPIEDVIQAFPAKKSRTATREASPRQFL